MHHCLHINEILLHIADRLLSNEADLLHFALVCQAFYNPAMDTLWACTPYVLAKLLLCLPRHRIYTTQLILDDARPWYKPTLGCALKTTPDPTEWDRFALYARRVKSIYLCRLVQQSTLEDSEVATTSLLQALRHHFHDINLFPSLRGIVVDDVLHEYLDIFTIANPTICCIKTSGDDTLEKTLLKLRPCAPQLEILEICPQGPEFGVELSSPSAQALVLLGCNRLISLETFVPVLPEVFAFLSQSTSLEHLELTFPFRNINLTDVQELGPLQFSNLRQLGIIAPAKEVAAFLHLASLPSIEGIQLIFPKAHRTAPTTKSTLVSDPDVDDAVRALGRLPHPCLVLLSISIDDHDPTSPTVISGDVLLSLTCLPKLSTLHFEGLLIDLRSHHILPLATAWLDMQTLRLPNDCPGVRRADPPFQPLICIEDLLPFAQHCPLLRELVIAVASDAASGSSQEALEPEPPVVHRSLRDLWLLCARAEKAEDRLRIARFVRGVFPEVRADRFGMSDYEAAREIRRLLEGVLDDSGVDESRN